MNENRTPSVKGGSRLVSLLLTLVWILASVSSSLAALPPDGKEFGAITLPPEAQSVPASFAAHARASSHPKLDSAMASLAAAARVSAEEAVDLAKSRLLRLSGNRVHVQIVLHAPGLEKVVEAVTKAGGEVTGIGNKDTLVQGWLPVDALETVAAQDDVYLIRRPAEVQLLDNLYAGNSTTEGLAVSNVPAWHAAGYTGAGIKIGIIDGNFESYTSLLGTDLPASVTVRNFVDGEDDGDVDDDGDLKLEQHGLACAEVIHDIAPDATLYLAKIATNLDLAEAVAWLKDTHQVDIISTSLGWYNLTPGDGTGEFADLVQNARNAGILWTTAAGNDREAHWGGSYSDPDADDIHNFNGTQEVNYFGPGNGDAYLIPEGVRIGVFVRWNDWANVNQDYDLYLLRWNGASWDTIASSTDWQDGGVGQTPTEFATAVTSGSDTAYGFVIQRFDGTQDVNLEIFAPKVARLDEVLHARSLVNLADAPDAMAVAAVDVTAPHPQESYSSEGPTNGLGGAETGGFIKPDIAAFANVSTESYGAGGFAGTSAATPHVAGAAALVLSAYPNYSPDQTQSFLEGRAIDMGPDGMDTQFGYGRLGLGDPPINVPSLSIDDVTVAEGVTGTVDAVFTVHLSGATSQQVAVDFATADDTAAASSDYVATSGTLTFPAGTTAQNITVLVNGDTLDEPNETFFVNLSNPTNATIVDGQGMGTIIDNAQPDRRWVQAAADGPPARHGHAMVYDTERRVVVLFGGWAESGLMDDTWEYDGSVWTQVSLSTSPPARAFHAMVYDSVRKQVVLFGGMEDGGALGDTWVYDGTNWTQVFPPAQPAPRWSHAMAYDGRREKVVLFGGYDGIGPRNETWEYDGTNWSKITPATVPSARYSHALAYNADRQRVMLFGGFDSRSLNDSWEYDGNDWVQLSTSAMPPPRYGHRLIYNSNLQQIVMFGGRQDATVFSDDTWEYDGSTWMQALPAAKPQPRAHHGLAYDSDRDRVVMFGGWDGWDGTPRFDDTWEYWSTAADLVVTMVDSPDPVTMGQNLTYTLTITNNGPITVTSVIVTDALPGSVAFVSASAGCIEDDGTVTCDLGTLVNGASATVAIVVTPATVGTVTNTASVRGNEPDSNMANNTVTENTTVNIPTLIISEVRVTNVRDTTFNVSWVTNQLATGEVHYGTDPANLSSTAYDDRGAGTSDETHYVTLQGLEPNTTYYFDVISDPTSDDNGGDHYAVTTGPTLGLPPSDTIWGQVFKEGGTTPAEGTIVYITLGDADGSGSPGEAAPLSALVDSSGYWYTNLGNARLADLSDYFDYSASDQLRLKAQGVADGAGCRTGLVGDMPTIIRLNVDGCTISWPMDIQLSWNHISLPVEPITPYTAEDVCGEINSQGGGVEEINRWYASGWDSHVCGLPFNDFDIELGSDYFIKGNTASTWSIEGYEVTTPVPLNLQVGWNSIGVPNTDAYTAESLCEEIINQEVMAIEIDRWYAGGWDGHICGLPFNDFDIEIGAGYFVKAGSAGTVTPFDFGLQIADCRLCLLRQADIPPTAHSEVAPAAAVGVRDLRVSNLRDTSVVLSWITDDPATGHVMFGETPPLDRVAYDVRGPAVTGDTHYVVLAGLVPETTYYFDIVSGAGVDDNGGAHYTVTTGPLLDTLPASDTVYGQVFRSDGVTPAEGAVLYLTLMDGDGTGSAGRAMLISALVDADGYWHANLGNARTADLSSYFSYSASGDEVEMAAQGAGGGTIGRVVDTANDSPAPPMVLTTSSCYNFEPPVTIGVEDVQAVANRWRQAAGPPYDRNGDGQVTIVDIMSVVTQWGQTCP